MAPPPTAAAPLLRAITCALAAILTLAGAAPPSAAPAAQPSPLSWQDQIVYVLIPHKFCDGNPGNNIMRDRFHLPNPKYHGGFLGGDIAGIRKHMDYIKDLGATSVLLYPVLENDRQDFMGYLPTGYRVRDYHRIDPNFGTEADFDAMLADFHSGNHGKQRVNVIMDLPMAMTGLEHPWNTDPRRYPKRYRPFDEKNSTDNITSPPRQMPYGPVDTSFGMPIINHADGADTGEGTYRAVRDDIVFWLANRFDIDGFRYDSAQNVAPAFWKRMLPEFHSRFNVIKPGVLHVGEVFIYPRRTWQLEQRDYMSSASGINMDGIYDFGLIERIQQVFAEGQDANRLAEYMRMCDKQYAEPARLIASVDNYEDPTFLQRVKDPANARERLWAASVFLMTADRVPFIYSGNERGMDTTQPGELFTKRTGNDDYLARFRGLVELRRRQTALRRGTMEWLQTSHTLLAYERRLDAQRLVVVLNVSAQPCSIDLEVETSAAPNQQAQDLLAPKSQPIPVQPTAHSSKGLLPLELAPWQARVLELQTRLQ